MMAAQAPSCPCRGHDGRASAFVSPVRSHMYLVLVALLAASDPASMRALAREYYDWRNRNDPVTSSDQGLHTQVLRLSRYRAARIGVDVNLHTGKWSFEEAVRYFMEAGGLDREAA